MRSMRILDLNKQLCSKLGWNKFWWRKINSQDTTLKQ